MAMQSNEKPTAEDLLRVIRKHCLDCSGGSRKDVRNCAISYCDLWPYRNPPRKKGEEKVKGQMTIFDWIGDGDGDTGKKSSNQKENDGRKRSRA